jgi:hypothetical protein
VGDLTRAWNEAQARLPDEWTLDSLKCASTGLRAEERSTDWIAVAVDDRGAERRHRAADPSDALTGWRTRSKSADLPDVSPSA